MLVYDQLLGCAPAWSGISFAVTSPVVQIHSKISLISNQAGLTIPTRGLGTRGPSPASPEQGVQHLEHKTLSAGILVCLCRASPCNLCNLTLLIVLGSHSVLIGEEEMPGALREGDSALHFCEGSEGYITFLLPLTSPDSILFALQGFAYSREGAGTTPEPFPMAASLPSTSQALKSLHFSPGQSSQVGLE